jgi:carboxymethylenebutenolidase
MKLDTGWVTFASAGEKFPAYFARPPRATPGMPALVIIHEAFGVDDYIEDVANRFAAAGYETLAPDLLSPGGTRPAELTRPRLDAASAFLNANPAAWSDAPAREAALAALPEDQRSSIAAALAKLFTPDEARAARLARYTEVLVAAVGHLKSAASRKIASVGFCMGGALSGLLAAAEPALDAAVVFYGTVPPPEQVAAIRCPMQGHYADPDPRITPHVPAFAEALQAQGVPFDVNVYPGARHAFFNDAAGSYGLDASRAAFARTLSFLLQHLT